jgi:Holliday junction DNA helicase RuvA
VVEGDTSALTRLPGIGKKTAERLVLEMRDRLESLPTSGDVVVSSSSGVGSKTTDPVTEAVSALISLGLKPPEASRRISALNSEGLPAEELVRLALRGMA